MKYSIIFDSRLWATFAQFDGLVGGTVGGKVENTHFTHKKQRFSRVRAYVTSTLQVNLN